METQNQPEANTTVSVPELAKMADMVSLYIEDRRTTLRMERRWKQTKYLFFGAFILTAVILYAVIYGRAFGFNANPSQDAVAMIPMRGEMRATSNASAEKLVPLISQACRAHNVKTVALTLDSGGGSPIEAERIMGAIKQCQLKKKRVVALVESTCASACYMVAMQADKIYAGRYSIVGSIGAIIRYMDASQLAGRFGVSEKVFKSGELKGGPSMLSPTSDQDAQLLNGIVKDMGERFLAEVALARKGKLKVPPADLSSGRVWTASEGKELGLVDDLAVLEELQETEFKGLKLHRYRLKTSFAETMGFESIVRTVMAELRQPTVE